MLLLEDLLIQTPEMEQVEYLSEQPPYARRIMARLFKLGFDLIDVQAGAKHPFFLRYAMQLLSFIPPVSDQKLRESIRRVLEKIAILTPDEIQSATTPPPTKKRKPQRSQNLGTLKRLQVMAAMYGEEDGSEIKTIAKAASISIRRLRDALAALEQAALISKKKASRKYRYHLTHPGITFLLDRTVTFRQCVILKCNSTTHCQNVTLQNSTTLIQILQRIEKVTKELVNWGWYPRNVKPLFTKHKLSYIESLIQNVSTNPAIENPGAYLWHILALSEKIPGGERRRKAAMASQILRETSSDVIDTFLDESESMSPYQALRFALALRSRYRKCQTKTLNLTIGDTMGIANWVRKKVRP
jgi:predicted transcriptional regulator